MVHEDIDLPIGHVNFSSMRSTLERFSSIPYVEIFGCTPSKTEQTVDIFVAGILLSPLRIALSVCVCFFFVCCFFSMLSNINTYFAHSSRHAHTTNIFVVWWIIFKDGTSITLHNLTFIFYLFWSRATHKFI